MCVDLFSPGYCLDISFLLEQVWVQPSKTLGNLEIKQVIDARIINRKGNKPLESLWMLLPHNYTSKEGNSRNICVETVPLTQKALEDEPELNWAFDEKNTSWEEDQGYISRPFTIEPPNIRLEGDPYLSSNYSGKIIVPKITFPEMLNDEHKDLLADNRVCKTLLCLKLDDQQQLKPGDAGWLRIICNPQSSDSCAPRQGIIPITQVPLWFEQRLTMSCPIMVRDRLKYSLESFLPTKEESHNLLTLCHELEQLIFKCIFSDGTSTRITDHRIALIAQGIHDFDVYPSQGAFFGGMINKLEKAGYTTLKWSAGANRNRNMDIVDNARRIIDMLRYNGAKSKSNLARDLSPSGMHEIFSTFIDKMKEAQLIKLTDPNNAEGPLSTDFAKQDNFADDPRMNTLRLKYHCSSQDKSIENLLDFTDLHPFDINAKLKWLNITDETISKLTGLFTS